MPDKLLNYIPVGYIHKPGDGSIGSIVLQVKDTAENIFALKLIGTLEDNLKNLIFKREIEALLKLNRYDDIVKIYDYQTHIKFNGVTNFGGILLEFVPGKNLDHVNFSEFSELQKLNVCTRIAKALFNAHINGILHRDIKPSNIMYYDEKIKIIDFGSSKIKAIVEKGTLRPLFTINYSAPEVVAGNEATEASDIYSLGAVFYKILSGREPEYHEKMISSIHSMFLNMDIKNLLVSMLEQDPALRPNNIGDVIPKLEKITILLNYSKYKYVITCDSNILLSLKQSYVVQDSITMPQFTAEFLPNEFTSVYGMYSDNNEEISFIGKQLCTKAIKDESSGILRITNIYELPIDVRLRLRNKSLKLEGRFEFHELRRLNYIPRNNNQQLIIMLFNHQTYIKSKENKTAKFNLLFGEWRESLQESILNTKETFGKIEYNTFSINGNKLYLTLRGYKNNSIDDLSIDTKFIIEISEHDKVRTYNLGLYEDTILDDNNTQIIIRLDNQTSVGTVKNLLRNHATIIEDYNAKISTFKRQIKAIYDLDDDNYNARNLKDIILDIESATSTDAIKDIDYIMQSLNPSQKSAVKKALNSDSISLIQGPPGTGKTKVIIEILNQIVFRRDIDLSPPKILVVSQSHNPVDNIIEGLLPLDSWSSVKLIRIGDKKNIAPKISEKYTLEAARENSFNSVREKSNHYMTDKLSILNINESDNYRSDNSEAIKWLKIREIQQDWISRCADYELLDYQLVNCATIIAGTCVGFLSNEYVKDMTFDYVIVDEAAKATTPELLISIMKATKIILVGDQNQLPPFADDKISPLQKALIKRPEYRIFDILYDILPDTNKQFLNVQYRMTSNIGNMISKIFYRGDISTGIDDEERKHSIPFLGQYSIIWFSTSRLQNHSQNSSKGESFYNLAEMHVIKYVLNKIIKLDNANSLDIGIITAYIAQKNVIRKAIDNGFYQNVGSIDVNTVDAFQGRENSIIIYSTVRTLKSIGFQKEKERINVAFSRAKTLLIIIGDLEFFYNWDNGENKYVDIINYIKENPSACNIVELLDGELNEEIH